MKKSRFIEEQIAFALHQSETGTVLKKCAGRWVLHRQRFINGRKNMVAWVLVS